MKDKKTLVLYTLHDPENPIELAFQQRYGHIANYHWSANLLLSLLLWTLLFILYFLVTVDRY